MAAPHRAIRTTGGKPGRVDKSALTLPAPAGPRPRPRQICRSTSLSICGRQPADAHHLRFAQSRALGRKVSDEFTVPLCRGHHREVHRYGDEAAWWQKAGVDPTVERSQALVGNTPAADSFG